MTGQDGNPSICEFFLTWHPEVAIIEPVGWTDKGVGVNALENMCFGIG